MGFSDLEQGNCNDALNYYNSYAIKLIELVHIIMCVSSIIISFLFYYYCSQYFYFHKNCRILILFILTTNLVHGLSFALTQGQHLVRIFIVSNPCDLLTSNRICFVLRFPAHLCTIMYVMVQAAVALERCSAVFWSRRYEKMGSHLGCLLVVAVISVSVPISVLVLLKWDLSDTTPFCSNVNVDTYQDMYSLICFYNTAVSLISLLIFVYTRFYNKQQLKRRDLNVSHRYQLQENENVFKILYPEIGFYFTFYVFYASCNIISYQVHNIVDTRNDFRVFMAAINTIPYYSFLSPSVMWWRLKRSRLERKTAVVEMTTTKQCDVMKAYFETLEAQWGGEKEKKSLPSSY